MITCFVIILTLIEFEMEKKRKEEMKYFYCQRNYSLFLFL